MKEMNIEESARQLWETSGAKAIAEAAQKVRTFEDKGDKEQAEAWRRIETALRRRHGAE
jgi:hypothetical protein